MEATSEYRPPLHSNEGSGLYVYSLAIVAALGGLLFGYDTAVISGAIGSLSTYFELNAMWRGWATSSALIGCMVGVAFAGVLSDGLGRKAALQVSAVLFLISAIGTAFPRTFAEFITARFVGGMGVGTASMLSPMYIAEIAPPAIRGRLVSLNQLAIVFGMLVVYFVNSQIAAIGDETWNVTLGWRWMFGSEILPSVLFLVFLLFIPESPRWLLKRGESQKAQGVLTRLAGSHQAQAQMEEIQATLEQEPVSFSQLFRGGLRIAMIIGIALAILQQVTGINVILYYAPEIFTSAGILTTKAINDTVIIGLINLIFTILAIWVVDKLGRKPLLLLASLGMGISLVFLGIAFILQQQEGLLSYNIHWWFINLDITLNAIESHWLLVFCLTYVGSFAIAMGPVVWVLLSEIFPTHVRGRAMSLCTECLWLSCFAVAQFFPIMLEVLHGKVFFIYALMCLIAFLFILIWVPETKGKSLEEIEHYWKSK